MRDLTCIYYTSNNESPFFEQKIQATLLEMCRGLPIVSVSQKPIHFGHNICVGEVGASGHNAWRQVQIGAAEAKSRFVCMHEADFLHPSEYFDYVPPAEDVFCMAVPLYVLFAQSRNAKVFFKKPRGSEGSMVVGREFLLNALGRMFEGKPMWTETAGTNVTDLTDLYTFGKYLEFETAIPTVTFKTDACMHRKTPFKRETKTRDLPFWGNASELVRTYCQ